MSYCCANLEPDPNHSDNASKHYLLKCTDGIFEGKFLYMNTTPDGELFGAGDPDDNEDITMYIELAGLAERHA
jgi:hypothetical protein